jgi:hypothetical protein
MILFVSSIGELCASAIGYHFPINGVLPERQDFTFASNQGKAINIVEHFVSKVTSVEVGDYPCVYIGSKS